LYKEEDEDAREDFTRERASAASSLFLPATRPASPPSKVRSFFKTDGKSIDTIESCSLFCHQHHHPELQQQPNGFGKFKGDQITTLLKQPETIT
jgi:hypothetical protein